MLLSKSKKRNGALIRLYDLHRWRGVSLTDIALEDNGSIEIGRHAQ
jgi:hypothetical protein